MDGTYLTHQQLQYFNGEYAAPAYIAVDGVIYDVSKSKHWKFGRHHVIHLAGRDLTEELKDAPHAEEIIKNFPIVGFLLENE